MSLSRVSRDGEGSSRFDRFEADDLAVVAEIVDLAHLWICEQAELIAVGVRSQTAFGLLPDCLTLIPNRKDPADLSSGYRTLPNGYRERRPDILRYEAD